MAFCSTGRSCQQHWSLLCDGMRAVLWLALLFPTVFLTGCGHESEEKTPEPPMSGSRLDANEMVKLSAKSIPRDVEWTVPSFQNDDSWRRPPEPSPNIDPGREWETEEMSTRVAAYLKRWLTEEVSSVRPDETAWRSLLASVFENEGTEVRRLQEPMAPFQEDDSSLEHLYARFHSPPRAAVKVVGITVPNAPGEPFLTESLMEWFGQTAAGRRRQINARWQCQWSVEQDLRLQAITVLTLEEVTSSPWFTECTASVLREVATAPIVTGIEFWSQRVTRYGDLYQTGHHGLAVGDVNGDGREDVYVCDGGSLPNRLYLQQPDGSVKEVSAEAGVDFLEDSRGALLVDWDNDGDQDLAVATVAMIVFCENDGKGNFTLRGGHMGAPYPASISAADVDVDGDVDLFVCVYEGMGNARSVGQGFQARTPTPFHDAENGGPNILLENLGDFQFVDSTSAFGLDLGNARWSFAAAWEDMDRDGDPDLYVANDFGRNQLYRNDRTSAGGRRLVNIAHEVGVEDRAAGMSVAWGDYNRDGSPDLYVGNMYSSAGHRIAYQRAFVRERDEKALLGTQRMARGNTLFAGSDGAFDDVSVPAGVTMGRWAWSSAFADLNNDGWEDLLVANGYLTNHREDDL